MERIKEAIRLAREHRQSQGPMPVRPRRNEIPSKTALLPPQELSLDVEMLPTSRAHLEMNRVLLPSRGNVNVAAFDMLRTKVVQDLKANEWQMVLVTSPTAGCGKTVSAINLALSIARQPEQHVVLLDLDLRKPRVAANLGISPRHQLQDVLTGEVPLQDALFSVDIGGPHLSFLVNTHPIAQPVEVLVSRQMQDIVSSLRQSIDRPVIVVDMPPVLMSDDVLAFLPQTDCSLLVVAEGQSILKEIESSEKLLSGGNLLGCILTKSTEPVENYY
jgi:protein-tyrosine kinase